MSKPTKLQIDIAILCLQHNGGDIEEKLACDNVASWLITQVENDDIRKLAKEKNVSYVQLKKRIRTAMGNK